MDGIDLPGSSRTNSQSFAGGSVIAASCRSVFGEREFRQEAADSGSAHWQSSSGKAPGRERLVSGVKERKLLELVNKNPDATLVELAKLLDRSARLTVSETTMWRSLRRLGLTRKKRVSARANARAQT